MKVLLQFLRLQRVHMVVWLIVVPLITAVVAGSASSVTQGNAFQELIASLPLSLQRLIGAHISNPVDAFVAVKLLLIIPALCGVSGALSASAIVAGESERGTLDFLLSLPVDRRSVLSQRFLAVCVELAVLYLATWIILVTVLKASGLSGSYHLYGLAMLAGLAINMGQSGLTLALSSRIGEYGRTVRYGLALVLVPFGFELALKTAGALPWLRYLLLYRLADSVEIMTRPGLTLVAAPVGILVAYAGLRWAQESFAARQLEA
ncbi:MAG: ABC transporter permease subunit [Ignavibacteriales bacterium]